MHMLLDAWDCSPTTLNDVEAIESAVREAVRTAGATLVDLCVHQFSPHGLTAVATLAESHHAIHTWPESGYMAADLFYCGAGDARRALEVLVRVVGAGRVEIQEMERGGGAIPLHAADATALCVSHTPE